MAAPSTSIAARKRKRRYSQADALLLTHAELLRRLHYDPVSGVFTWRCGPRNRVGQVAGSLKSGPRRPDGRRYRIINIGGVLFRANRLAWFYMTGEWPVMDIDHKDTDRTNDRWANLRPATRSQNNVNTGLRNLGASGAKGVIYDPRYLRPWKACASVKNKTTVIGRFATKEEAVEARATFDREAHGEFARHEG